MAVDPRGVPEDLPASARAYEGFEGYVSTTMAGSTSWWPDRPVAPEGAPNVVVVLCDDLGYSDLGCFGSEIETLEVDRLAAEGVRYTNFHVNPMCSPTRASLLTGRNSHAAGIGYVAHADPGFPGQAMELADDVVTLAEALRDNGYATLMVGKWHLCKDTDATATGSRASWPLQRGFERFYGILDGLTDLFHPHALYRDNSPATPQEYPEGYYFTDDITDEAISMVRSVKASDPTKPFFLYFSHGAVHAPLNAPAPDIERHRGRYAAGWDEIRRRRFDQQIELGIFPEGTALPPRNSEPGDDVPAWDSLTADEQLLFARYMEVYAGMVQTVDRSLGQLRGALEEIGEWENTIVLFCSDNGASREGEAQGSSQYFDVLRHYHGAGDLAGAFDRDLAAIDAMGGPRTLPHYPRGWAMASNTPFRLYKINTHAGGHSSPLVVSWPQHLAGSGGQLRDAYVHVTDVFPTIMELAGVSAPEQRHGVRLKPVAGCSFAPTLTNDAAPSRHHEQYHEMQGHRGFYRDGWQLVTRHQPRTPFGDHEWELYDLRTDPAETANVAAEHPDIVADLAQAWEQAAWQNQVFPLDEGTGLMRLLRPGRNKVFTQPVRIVPGTPTLDRFRSWMLVLRRDFAVEVELDYRAGDEGVLFVHGCKSGGYSLDIEGGHLRYLHNLSGEVTTVTMGAVAEGKHVITLAATESVGGTVVGIRVLVDGVEVGGRSGLDMPMGMAIFQGIDVGIDRGSPLSWQRYEAHGAFPYTGHLTAVTWIPGKPLSGNTTQELDKLRKIGLSYE